MEIQEGEGGGSPAAPAPALKSALKDPNAAPKEKKSVKVGFGGESDEEDTGKGKSKEKKKESKDKGKGSSSSSSSSSKGEKKAVGDVEESLRVNTQEIDHASWLKKTQSVAVFADSPWATLKITIGQAKNVPLNEKKRCDCFVRGSMGQTKYTTETIKAKGGDPVFDETCELPCEPDQALKFRLFDQVGKGNRTPDVALGFLKVRIKNMKPGKVYDKWYDMKPDEVMKDKDKIELKLTFCLTIRPVITNKIYSKIYCQPTWVQCVRNPTYAESPSAAEMRLAVEKLAERIVQWYNSYDSFVADQRWKLNILDVTLSHGQKEIFGTVTYENRSRAPGMKSETLEYELIAEEDDDDDDDMPIASKQFKQLGFVSYHALVPKDIVKKCTESKKSADKTSLFNYKKRCDIYPGTMAELIFKTNAYLSDNRDLHYMQTSCVQTNVSNHVVAWYVV